MLNEEEIKELRFYKNFTLVVFISHIIFPFGLYIFVYLHYGYKFNALLFVVYKINLISIIFLIFLSMKNQLYKYFELQSILLAIQSLYFTLIASLMLSNIYLFNVNCFTFIIIFFFLFISYVYLLPIEIKKWKLIISKNSKLFDGNIGVINPLIYEEDNYAINEYKIKAFNKKVNKIIYYTSPILLLISLITYSSYTDNLTLKIPDFRKPLEFAGFSMSIVGLIAAFSTMQRIILVITRIILCIKWERTHHKKLYTRLKLYIDREVEINRWRREQGLKPVKIKSPFFLGRIDK